MDSPEILYAFASASGNNGSAFAGLNANTPFYNISLTIAMLMGRVAILLPTLAIAGSLTQKKITPVSPGAPLNKLSFVRNITPFGHFHYWSIDFLSSFGFRPCNGTFINESKSIILGML